MSHSGVQCLDFSGNEIDYISHELLNYFPNLKFLNLEKNKISNISSGAFKSFVELVDLNLSGNKLRDLPDDLFNYNLRLQILDLDDITIEDDEENALNRFQELSIIIFKTLRYCQIYGVSSLSDLLSKPLLRVAVWGISVVTLVGNTLVLWGRFIYKDENRVLSIVIRNLAVADMLMGVYLLAIGLEDFNLRDMYNKEANKWISSWQCTFLGMIAMISCEVSVLILSFMSIERFIVIVIAPFSEAPSYFTCRSVTTSMIIIWIIGILLSVIPGIYWRESTRFYGLNGMCFPLHIDEAFMIGWQYSAFIFLGVNLLGLIIIGSVYLGMFLSIRRIRQNTPLTIGDSEIALRFFFIVLTDALCSAPVILLKILALQKYPILPCVHAWVVVFILPVNGAINPILYTFTVPKFKKQFSEYCFRRI
ncbi:Similar to RXFP2: Relaxin receptor 2 (Homo sapiens) [Cotesia congregata]|uniref:Similar to RXFP2: Relaxin receptor 2 (Homo sapiens) n=1 Tax=Cotesia congregata TaxID=51543 RepID=A0A8J2HEV2_COTCN|nr:Similar to RXFP2: Relaxin receptor 2 (Homo sapiens) [Cotesia congregata]